MSLVTHYDTLKVSRAAPTDVVRAAYRALAQKFHPDRNLDNPEAVLMMQLINIAYNTLTDGKKRADHDAWIATQEPKKAAPVQQLTPEQQAKRDKNIKEITAWESFAAKETKEAEASRAKAAKAAQQASAAADGERAKWDAYAKQAADDARAAEAKAAKATQQAREKIAALGGVPVPVVEKKIVTHYDTLFVDRGAPQVGAAAAALAALGIEAVALCGLAKRLEEVWLPGRDTPVILSRTSEALYLLQRVRDEAHRFAIEHHRGRRDRAMTGSVLDELKGIGPARKRALLQHFGSPERFLAATREELEAVPGLPAKVGREIHEQLNRTN